MIKMKTYLMQNDDYPLDVSLFNTLDTLAIGFQSLALPADHNDVGRLLNDLEGGTVFMPAVWKDLFGVKIVQEFSDAETPFETVMVDATPEVSDLIIAFNEGLSAYLETPVTKEKLRIAISRTRSRFEKKISQWLNVRRLSDLASRSNLFNGSQTVSIRNQYLGKAFIDMANKTGPLFDGEVAVLLVSSSSARQNQLGMQLKAIGISAVKTGNVEETIEAADKKEFTVVISDSILPDGDAILLANRLRKTSKRMPPVIVWSSSPEKTADLLKPEHHIDEVIIKAGPETGIESVLPSIIAVIYGKGFMEDTNR